MRAQILLNVMIAFLWMLLIDADAPRLSTFFAGYIVGMMIIFMLHRFFGSAFYLKRLISCIKLLFTFISELVKSSILVLKQILSPKLKIQPGIFRYETILESDIEITMISLLLTLTPGSVVMEVMPEGNVLYVHAMDVEKERGAIISQLKNYEKAITEVTRS
ncbi:MAG TPA: Na+/H+ antiporter subunit E [Sporosarcina sp.]|nr:Na+/H+ antiporter subunit E [Sporosarcina sp.]